MKLVLKTYVVLGKTLHSVPLCSRHFYQNQIWCGKGGGGRTSLILILRQTFP